MNEDFTPTVRKRLPPHPEKERERETEGIKGSKIEGKGDKNGKCYLIGNQTPPLSYGY